MEPRTETPASPTPFSDTQQTLEDILEARIRATEPQTPPFRRIVQKAGEYAQIIGGIGFGSYALGSGLAVLFGEPQAQEAVHTVRQLSATYLIGIGTISALFGLHTLFEQFVPDQPSPQTRWITKKYTDALPTIRENLPTNPNAHLIYALIHTHLERGTRLENVIEIVEGLSTNHDETLGPVISAIARRPDSYEHPWRVESALRDYAHAHTLHPITARLIRLKRPDLNGIELVEVDELFPKLIERGWEPYQINIHLEQLIIPRTNEDVFFDAYLQFDSDVVRSAVKFYDSPSNTRFLSDEQRLAIAKKLFEHGNRGYAQRFRTIRIEDERIGSYIASLDRIPSIGTKGQMHALLSLDSALTRTPHGIRAIHEVLEPALEGVRKDEESERALEVFLERHPNIDREAALTAFAEYSALTQGAPYTNEIIEQDATLASQGRTLKERTARKIIEKIKHKTEIVRYERFQETLRTIQLNTLESFIGTTIPEEHHDLAMSESMTNVLIGASDNYDSAGIDRTTFADLLHISVTEPEQAEAYILSLEGNQNLKTTLEDRIEPWRAGLRKRYRINESALDPVALEDHYESLLMIANEAADTTDALMHARALYERIKESGDRTLTEKARTHLQAIEQITQGPSLVFEDSKNPIESMQMGVVSGSCTNITRSKRGFNASVANTIDANKKVIYHTNESAEKIGRTLAVLTDTGIITYEVFNKSHFDIGSGWTDYFVTYAEHVRTPLIVPATFAQDRIRTELESRGAEHVTNVEATLHHAVSDGWYNDRNLARRELDGSFRYENLEAFVLTPARNR